MRVDEDTVRKLAALAELELGEEEVARMRRDLEKILDYVEKLEALDTDAVPPTRAAFDLATPFRDDRADHVTPVEEALRNAPAHGARAMIVPKVIE